MNGNNLSEMIRRRKSKSKRRQRDDCDSGAARRYIPQETPAELNLELQDPRDREGLPPKIIRTASVKRPIHIEPAISASIRYDQPPPEPTIELFQAIAGAYGLTTTQCRELLDALTKARLILGYKHPIARLIQPFSAA